MRVVSLLPAATEMIFAIGAGDTLVGRSHRCDYPEAATRAPALTSVRPAPHEGQSPWTLDEALLRDLRPDVILTQSHCAARSIDCATVQRVAATLHPRPHVMNLGPTSVWQVFDDLLAVGDAVDCSARALQAATALRDRWWTAAENVTPYVDGPSVLFLECTRPPRVGGLWTPHLITAAGGRHLLNAEGEPSRVAGADEILASEPTRVVVCPCGLDLARTRLAVRDAVAQPWWREMPAARAGRPNDIMLVDGNQMFHRPGPRLVDAFEWLVAWLGDRPSAAPPGFPCEPLK